MFQKVGCLSLHALNKYMKPFAFSHLSLSSQSNHLWKDGELLGIRYTPLFEIKLYSVYFFLVEVIVLKSAGHIECIRIMDPKDGLEDYYHLVTLPVDLI